MFFLKKIFQLRDNSNPEAEKPFLEHLEDLRICITRIVLTLLIATVVCFIFRGQLMDIIRRPVVQVWERTQVSSLKESKISLDDWETAKGAAQNAIPLSDELREHFFNSLDSDGSELRENVEAIYYFRAALVIEDKKARKKFVENLPGVEDAIRAKVLSLLEGMPNASVDARGKLVLMQTLKPTESFMLSIKLAFFAGMVVSFPFLLYFILQFVLPGMHETERRALWPAMAIGFGLFLCGVFFAYYIVMPRVLEFFHDYSSQMKIENEWRIGYYISFATQFTLIFGLSFELPVVVMTLVKLSILNSQMMRSTRAYAILSIFVIAAIITPTPDAFTLCLLAGPMIVLYELCIWLAVLLERKQRRLDEEEEQERMERLLARRERIEAQSDKDNVPDHDPDLEHDPHYHDPHDEEFDEHHHLHDEEFDEHHHQHDEDHDYHADHEGLEDSELGYGDDGHTGEETTADSPGDDRPSYDKPILEQPDFDFHEETDPALTEEGEQEDISDPWPEEGDEDHLDPHDPPEDIPDEERDRENPDKRDTD